MGISIRAYARHRGVTDTAVHKAIRAGRITPEADGTIDADRADREWARNSDVPKAGTRAKAAKAVVPDASTSPNDGPAALPTGGTSLLQARTVNEVVKAQTNKVRLARLKGELVDRPQAIAHVFKLARSERDAAFQFDFERDDPTLRALGRRIVGWVLGPDWTEPVVERLEWLTDVMESHAGVEQRVRLREAPRRHFEYRVLVGSDRARAHMENRLVSWQARVYGLPVWADAWIATDDIAPGATSLVVPTTNRDFVVGGIVGLVNGLQSEFAEITAVGPSSIVLNDPISGGWPAGTKIVPVRSARVQNDLGLTYVTDAIAITRPQFQLEDEWPITASSESPDYLGYPVLLTPPNWREDLQGEFGRKWRDLDYLTGRRAVDDLTGLARTRRSHRWLLVGRPAIAAFRSWLAARAGKLKPFWLPSFQSDLKVIAPTGGTDAFLTVENRSYAEGPVTAIGRRDLMIVTTSGGRFYRRITAASELSESSELIAIDNPIGATLLPEQFHQISFMQLVRLDTDNVEIAHVTDEVAEVVLPLRSLRDDL